MNEPNRSDGDDPQAVINNQKQVIAQLTRDIIRAIKTGADQKAVNAALLDEIERLREEITVRDQLLRDNLLAGNRVVAKMANLPVRYRHA